MSDFINKPSKFISEEIIMEEDKKYYYSFNPSNILGEPMDAYWWAIDKKKGNFIYMRGNGSPAWNCISSFGLFIDGEQIFIEAEEDMKGRLSQNNIEITWTIQKIAIPKQLLYVGYEIDSIKKLIKEALEGLGHVGCERSEIKKVQVILDVEPELI